MQPLQGNESLLLLLSMRKAPMEILNLDLHQISKFREFRTGSSVQSITYQSYLQNAHPNGFFQS